mmetsp:Transcript_2049/g.3146  ORF Transcript_2049/g.3146 Transcript_2049/m.3146 type:complete len:357 (-) Transcript_2049:90-1160(-)
MTAFGNTVALLITIIAITTYEVVSLPSLHQWGVTGSRSRSVGKLPASFTAEVTLSPLKVRGGSSDTEDEYESDVDLDESDEESDDESQDESDDESDDESEVSEEAVAVEVDDSEYDKMIVPSPISQLYSIFGVMIISRRLDMTSPTVVRACRFSFIAYVVVLQLFLLYVRFQVKAANDRTVIKIDNPLSKVMESATKNNEQVKDIASSFLNSQSTIMEYDLQQVKSMNGGLLVNMGMMWIMHFKMGQTQPLILQAVQGLMNLYYSPLFQVYILGRNLKRPFSNPKLSGLMEKAAESAGINMDSEDEPEESKTEEKGDEEEDEDEEEYDSDVDEEDDDVDDVDEEESEEEEDSDEDE